MTASVDLRDELLQLEASLSREALWKDAGVNLPNPREALESRRDAILAELSQFAPVTMITTLSGYSVVQSMCEGSETELHGVGEDPDHVRMHHLLPEGTVEGVQYDFEITVTRRPRAKETA